MSKNAIVDQTQYEHSYGIMDEKTIKEKLTGTMQKMIYKTVDRFKNGSCACYFSEPEMIALSEDLLIKAIQRVLIYQKDPTSPLGVNPRGMTKWYEKCFKNQIQKDYEKYAKTDIRAGVQTVSSDEALTVASSKNLVNPENHYILMKEFTWVVNQLQEIDNKHNKEVVEKFNLKKQVPSSHNLSHNAKIITMYLEGYTPDDIKENLELTDSEFGKHRKNALNNAKDLFPSTYTDLLEHFDTGLDLRLFTRDVKKRQKKDVRMKEDFVLKAMGFIDTFYSKNSVIIEHVETEKLTAFFNQVNVKVKDSIFILPEKYKESAKKLLNELEPNYFSKEENKVIKKTLSLDPENYIVVNLRANISYMVDDVKSKDIPAIIVTIDSIICHTEEEASNQIQFLRNNINSAETLQKIQTIKEGLIKDHPDLKVHCS